MTSPARNGRSSDLKKEVTTTLLVRTAKLDQRAMTELMSRIRPRISSMVRGLVKGQPGNVDDCVAECLLAVVRGFDGFDVRQGSSFNGWLSVIVRNKVIDSYRKRSPPTVPLREPDSEGPGSAVPSPDPTPSAIAMRREGDDMVAQLMNAEVASQPGSGDEPIDLLIIEVQRLPPHQRAVLVRRILLDAPFAEIARELGISEANARMRYMFARRTLLARLATHGVKDLKRGASR